MQWKKNVSRTFNLSNCSRYIPINRNTRTDNELKHYLQIYLSGLFRITNAAITPGTQPQSHNKNTIKTDPQPLPITDNGGKKIAKITRQKLMMIINLIDVLM